MVNTDELMGLFEETYTESYDDEDIIKRLEEAIGFPFSDEQLRVLRAKNDPLSVISCAGAGKTTVLIAKIIYLELFKQVPAQRILGVTFNKEASNVLVNRYKKLMSKFMGHEPTTTPTFSTFHSLFLRILKGSNKYKNTTIATESQFRYELLKTIQFDGGSDSDNLTILESFFSLRSKLLNSSYYQYYFDVLEGKRETFPHDLTVTFGHFNLTNFINVMQKYESLKASRNAIDFEDMQIKLLQLLLDGGKPAKDIVETFQDVYSYIFLDEYQDVNYIQKTILDILMSENQISQLTVIGDVDQCQPAGTQVSLYNDTIKPIEEIMVGDTVLSYNPDTKQIDTSRGYRVHDTASHVEQGLYTLKTKSGKVTQYTAGHKTYVVPKLNHRFYFAYFRLSDDGRYHFGMFDLENIPHVDSDTRIWVLKASPMASDVDNYVTYLTSLELNSHVKVMRYLKKHGMNEDYPFDINILKQNGEVVEVRACHIFPEVMDVLEVNEGVAVQTPISKYTYDDTYEGIVYSLKVEGYENYIADNIVTHNCIYAFRGSEPQYILNFLLSYPNAKRLFLGENYRCKSNILMPVVGSIERNKARIDYDMRAFNEGGNVEKVVGTEAFAEKVIEHAIPSTDIILVRANHQQMVLSDILTAKGYDVVVNRITNTVRNNRIFKDIMFTILGIIDDDIGAFKNVGTKIFPYVKWDLWKNYSKEGETWKDDFLLNHGDRLPSHVKTTITTMDTMGAQRLIIEAYKLLKDYYTKMMKKGIYNEQSIEEVVRYMIHCAKGLTIDEYLDEENRKERVLHENFNDNKGIKIATMHSVKGLEYDNVFLYGIENNAIPNMSRKDQFETHSAWETYLEEERRLFYVAWTRAKDKVVYHYENEDVKSPFLDELETW